MHVCVMAAGFLATVKGSPMLLLALLVLVKTGVDAAAHVRAHSRAVPRAA
jgi:uncharacterized protein DUF6498